LQLLQVGHFRIPDLRALQLFKPADRLRLFRRSPMTFWHPQAQSVRLWSFRPWRPLPTEAEMEEITHRMFMEVFKEAAAHRRGFPSRAAAIAMGRAAQRLGEKYNDPQLVRAGADLERRWK